jgi:hypothetical protein
VGVRALTTVAVALAVAVGGVAHALPAYAAAATEAQDPVDRAASDKQFVRWVAGKDPRSTVRVSAWSALISNNPDAAVAAFLRSGYDYAKRRAAETRARNLDFAKRVLSTHTAEHSPEVHAAAKRAVNGTDTDRELFARTGYAAAKERDRQAREAAGEHARAIVQADRDYVAMLRDHDPGPQIRASAAWALRPGSTDSDLVEFFAYGWASGAALDLATFCTQAADNDAVWRVRVARLVTDAQAAERAAQEASGEAAEKAREAAAQAWRDAGDGTDPARSAWRDAQTIADAQAANWRAVVIAATAATGPNWEAVIDPARANEAEWIAEQEFAAEQARFWTALLEQALAGEERMRTA